MQDSRLGWVLHKSGQKSADCTILLIPGGLCSAAFFDDVMLALTRSDASLGLLATTIPGYAGTPPPEDLSQESYGRSAAKLAKRLGCDIVVGHSMGANVAIEMVVSGAFSGPVVLLSPAFSFEAEAAFLRVLDRFGRIPGLGLLAWKAITRMAPGMMKNELPAARRDAWLAELQKNDARFFRAHVRRYLEHLKRQGSLAARLCDSGVKAWVVFGGPKDVRLQDHERRALDACPNVTVVDWPAAGHFTLGETKSVVELIAQAVRARATLRPEHRASVQGS